VSFIVNTGGEVNGEPEPEPNEDDRRRARLLAEGGNFDPDVEDLFAQGIAIARSGGDVRAFLHERARAYRNA